MNESNSNDEPVKTMPIELEYQIAKASYEVNRAYCRALSDTPQPTWVNAPAWIHESARAGVRAYLKNPSVTPAEMHEIWCEHKRAEGWVWGEKKNPDKKTHPCLVPYNELLLQQRTRDTLFIAVVSALAHEYRNRAEGVVADGEVTK